MRLSLPNTIIIFITTAFLATSCKKDVSTFEKVEGMKPVYVKAEDIHKIVVSKISKNFAIDNDAELTLAGNLLFVTDNGEGFYLWDNSNPRTPAAKLYFKVPGVSNSSLAVENGANGELLVSFKNYDDHVKMEIVGAPGDPYSDAKLYKRNVGYYTNFVVPTTPNTVGYFECYNPDKGMLVAWKKSLLDKPICFK